MSVYVYPPFTISTSLPTNAATEAKQDDIIVELQQIEADIEAGNTAQATAAKQDAQTVELQDIEADVEAVNTTLGTTNTTLSTIDGKITAVDTGNVTIAASTLPTGASTSANQSTANASLSNIESDINELNARLAGNLVPETFDHIGLTYVAAGNGIGEIETVIYKTGGSGGTTVATLTLAYDANDKLSAVARS